VQENIKGLRDKLCAMRDQLRDKLNIELTWGEILQIIVSVIALIAQIAVIVV
jgi:hypothetical protein